MRGGPTCEKWAPRLPAFWADFDLSTHRLHGLLKTPQNLSTDPRSLPFLAGDVRGQGSQCALGGQLPRDQRTSCRESGWRHPSAPWWPLHERAVVLVAEGARRAGRAPLAGALSISWPPVRWLLTKSPLLPAWRVRGFNLWAGMRKRDVPRRPPKGFPTPAWPCRGLLACPSLSLPPGVTAALQLETGRGPDCACSA